MKKEVELEDVAKATAIYCVGMMATFDMVVYKEDLSTFKDAFYKELTENNSLEKAKKNYDSFYKILQSRT